MKKIDIGQTIQILANVGVLAGIIFLIFEIQQNTVVAEMQAADDYLASTSELNIAVSQSAELAELLVKSRNGDELTEAEGVRVRLIHANLLRSWSRLYFLHERGVFDDSLWNIQRSDMRRNLESPDIVSYWESRRDQFDPGLNALIEGFLPERIIE